MTIPLPRHCLLFGVSRHELNEAIYAELRSLNLSRYLTVSKDRHSICDFDNLIQMVRDINYADSRLPKRSKMSEQFCAF